MDREPGLSVRLKLTLSYAGFLVFAGALLLVAAWLFVTHVRHVGLIFVPGYQLAVLRELAPTAAIALGFLLVFGLVGGWILAGGMLAPLTRITDATRAAANGSLSHRVRLPGPSDEFRELADAFDTMLARLEAHVAEQQRSPPTPPTNCARRWRSPRLCSRSLAKIRIATTRSSSSASTRSTPVQSISPKPCYCSAAPISAPSPPSASTCRSSPNKPPRRCSPSRSRMASPSRRPAA